MTPRERAAQAVVADLGSLVDEIVATIGEQIPAYRTLSVEQLAEVTAIASWGIRRILDLWTTDAGLGPADLQRFRGIGAARALDDRPIAGVLRAYRLAGQRIVDTIAREHAAGLSAVDALALAHLWMSAVDELSEALHRGHAETVQRLDADRDRALADLLDDLLDGRRVTLTALADRARRLDLSLPARATLVVLEPANADPPEAVLRVVRDGRAVLLCDTDQAAMTADAATAGARGVRIAVERPGDIRTAHRLATHALDHAPAHAGARRPLLDEGDAQLVALLTTGSGAAPAGDPARLAVCVLGDLLATERAHLLDGLRALLRTGSAVAAAVSLGVHPQTVRYRLARVRELTGRDPRDAWDHVVLSAAVLAADAGAAV